MTMVELRRKQERKESEQEEGLFNKGDGQMGPLLSLKSNASWVAIVCGMVAGRLQGTPSRQRL